MKHCGFEFAVLWLLCALAITPIALVAQTDAAPQPAPAKPLLQRIEAIDPASQIHYVRLLLSLPPAAQANSTPPPRFTIQCEDIKGKHQMQWFLSFGNVAYPSYEPPFQSSPAHLYPPHYPAVNLKMTFEGYIKSKPFIRSWSVMPTGELRYRNSGSDGPNMEPAQWYLNFLNSLPGLRVAYAKPSTGDPAEIFFPTQPLLDELNKIPLCTP